MLVFLLKCTNFQGCRYPMFKAFPQNFASIQKSPHHANKPMGIDHSPHASPIPMGISMGIPIPTAAQQISEWRCCTDAGGALYRVAVIDGIGYRGWSETRRNWVLEPQNISHCSGRPPNVASSCRNAVLRPLMPRKSKPAQHFRCVVYRASWSSCGGSVIEW